MATILLYQSKHGTTRKVSHMIAEAWTQDDIHVHDLAEAKVPDLTPYDTVLIGGSIYMGRIQRKVGQCCEALIMDLLTKKVGLFMCFLDFEQGLKEFKDNFPYALREHATAHGLFGGELLDEPNRKAIEAFISKMDKEEKYLSETPILKHYVSFTQKTLQQHKLMEEKKSFLNSIQKGDYRKAYSLIDDLQEGHKINMPKEFRKIEEDFYWVFVH